MMPRKQKFLQLPLVGKVFLGVLACVYLVYLAGLANSAYTSFVANSSADATVVEHPESTNSDVILRHWTVARMSQAIDEDEQIGNGTMVAQENSSISAGKAAKQQGQAPKNANVAYPISTVGKIFFTNAGGQDSMCSGTAVRSSNQSVVDTAGHCLYWNGGWVTNLIFCPLYENGSTPFGCWAARDLEVPADWIHPKPNDYHHDFGMAIVAPNDQGKLTDVVGGAGWAYNQTTKQTFSAYGYPAGYPFDGQTRKSCEGSGNMWQHGDGTVVSIPCDMTGGSSGGPWYMKVGGDWYVNGHNDFVSSIQRGHMFSPYYDDTWYALYNKAQRS